jgi:hypothetical protein
LEALGTRCLHVSTKVIESTAILLFDLRAQLVPTISLSTWFDEIKSGVQGFSSEVSDPRQNDNLYF